MKGNRDDIESLRVEIAKLTKENAELLAKVWILERDIAILAPENIKLCNAYNAALGEVARLKTPKKKGKRGRPPKDTAGNYETYLFRETMQIVTESMWGGGKKITERDASIIADGKIRDTAAELQAAGIQGAFVGIAANYPKEKDSIYNAFRRGKRLAGFAQKARTKK